ncbi:hypothetical protein L195_g048254 [Trifolium pratense]|uniref:Uncharacterized protein n=1 Tax=Trifolium pratense TaxID=57577 RepID=A0A2K3JKR4_TRIPR|nr:hypothetical protein L195_g048254 [Trifolium pratense]
MTGELGGDAPAIELVEVGGRLVEVAEGGGREVGSVTAGGEEGERGEVAEGGADRGPVAGEEEEREEVAEGGGGEVSEDIEERGVEDRALVRVFLRPRFIFSAILVGNEAGNFVILDGDSWLLMSAFGL